VRRRLGALAFTVLTVATAGAHPVSAQCRAATSDAAIAGGTHGPVTSSHYGRMIKNDCATQRRMGLKTEVHLNDRAVVDTLLEGPLEYLGGSMLKDYEFRSCDGKWDSSTRFGTLNPITGQLDVLHFSISGILFASCPPPPDGGPGTCGGGHADTSTLTLTAGGGGKRAGHQLGFGLSRFEERPEGYYLFDEWALLAFGADQKTRMRLSSTAAFKERVAAAADAYRRTGAPRRLRSAAEMARLPPSHRVPLTHSLVLVVEAGNHPHNDRHIPLPGVEPMTVDLGHLALGYGRQIEGEIWFRAEVAPAGEVDRLILLESTVLVADQYLHEAIRDNLKLRFATDKRHRVVVFGVAEVSRAGLLTLEASVPVTPQCCCTFNPEGPRCV
jgi:hypothetical protein